MSRKIWLSESQKKLLIRLLDGQRLEEVVEGKARTNFRRTHMRLFRFRLITSSGHLTVGGREWLDRNNLIKPATETDPGADVPGEP